MPSRRIERINARIREIISKAILYELKDPRVGFCTITRVETSADLKCAKVFVSIMGDTAEAKRTLKALEHARGHLQRKVAEELKARYSPVVQFVEDPSIKASIRISKLLREDKEDSLGEKNAEGSGLGS